MATKQLDGLDDPFRPKPLNQDPKARPPTVYRDQGEFNLWIQWNSLFLGQHKMLPDEAARMADLCLEECRARQPTVVTTTTRQ